MTFFTGQKRGSLSSRGVEREGPGFTLDVPVADANNPHLPAPLSHQGAYPRESRWDSDQDGAVGRCDVTFIVMRTP